MSEIITSKKGHLEETEIKFVQSSKDGRPNGAFGIAIGCDGTIYVSDCINDCIRCFNPDGTFICKWGKNGKGDGELDYPAGLAIGPFSETKNNVNPLIMREMKSIFELASFPPGVLPICVSYIGIDCIYVCDWCNQRIQVFAVNTLLVDQRVTKDFKFIRKWGTIGNDNGQFRAPTKSCVFFDKVSGTNLVYVSELLNNRIQVFSDDGKFISKWGTDGTGDYQFNGPRGILL